MGFRSVFGHESAIRALQRALAADELPGTYLFTGPQGIGKTTLALAMAESAACLTPNVEPFDSCGACESCRRVITGSHPEVMVIRPASEQTQIWQFWDRSGRPPGALQHTLNYAPVIGRRRVYIVERAETLNESAANSLLKVLEEPPPYVLFVLLAAHSARLLPTILSRSQLLRLTPAPADSLAAYLTQSAGVSPDRARALAAYSEGRTGAALSLARGKGIEAEINSVLDLAAAMASSQPLAAPAFAEKIRKQAAGIRSLVNVEQVESGAGASEDADSPGRERAGRRQYGVVLDLITAYYRDLLTSSLAVAESAILHADRSGDIIRTASRFSPSHWARCLEELMRARRHIDQNANPRLVTDALAIRLLTAGRQG